MPAAHFVSPDLARTWRGRGPHEEVWFIEARAGDGRGVWLRYCILDGTVGECTVSAILFDKDGVHAGREVLPLSDIDLAQPVFRAGPHHLNGRRAVGCAGALSWDLELIAGAHRHQHIAPLLRRLSVTSQHYVPAILDLRLRGQFTIGERVIELDREPGVLGHIHGRRSVTQAWAWCHCSHFDGAPGAVFEGLSPRVLAAGRPVPICTSLVLFADERRYAFSQPRDLLATRTDWGERRWAFRTRPGPVQLLGEVELPDTAQVAHVRFADTDGGNRYAANSPLAHLRLRLIDAPRGIDRELVSSSASFELGSRDPPDVEVVL